MSLIKVGKDNFELVKVFTNPDRTFTSSSLGTTGSVRILEASDRINDVNSTLLASSNTYAESSLEVDRREIIHANESSRNILGKVQK